MKSYLTKKKVRIEALGEEFELTALSASQHVQISDALSEDDSLTYVSLCCKFGVVAWNNESVDDIGNNVSSRALSEIAEKVYELSGVKLAKNSESVTGAASSSS